ncbi:MAG: tetratricopeptide repeat protein [Promethearchaeota archaeon]
MVKKIKCPICGELFPKKDIVCLKCSPFLKSKSSKERADIAKMLEIPGLGAQVKKMLSMSVEDLIGEAVGSMAKDFLDKYTKTGEGQKLMQQGREILDKLSPFNKKVLELIRRIENKKLSAHLFQLFLHGFRLHNIQQITELFEQLARIYPHEDDILSYLMMECYAKYGKNQKALNFLEEALKRDPNSGFKWGLKGMFHQQIKQYELAIQSLQKGIELNPENYRFHYGIAESYEALGEKEKAIEHIQMLLKEEPTDQRSKIKLQRLQRKEVTDEEYKKEMGVSQKEQEALELQKERELIKNLEEVDEIIENKEYINAKDKLEDIIHEAKQYHLYTLENSAKEKYNLYKKYWKPKTI